MVDARTDELSSQMPLSVRRDSRFTHSGSWKMAATVDEDGRLTLWVEPDPDSPITITEFKAQKLEQES